MVSSSLSEFKYSKVNLISFNIIPNWRAYIFQAYFLAKGIHELHLDSFNVALFNNILDPLWF